MGAATTITTVTKLRNDAKKKEEAGAAPPVAEEPKNPESLIRKIAGFLNGAALQTVLYFLFVVV